MLNVITPKIFKQFNSPKIEWILEQANKHLSSGKLQFDIGGEGKNHVSKDDELPIKKRLEDAGWTADVRYEAPDRPCVYPYLRIRLSSTEI